jgi:hypothetical protein
MTKLGATPTPEVNRETASPLGVRLGINRQERGEKPLNCEPSAVTSASRWLRITQVKVWLKRRKRKAAYVGYWLRPKGQGLKVKQLSDCLTFTLRRPGVKHHPTVTTNGHAERSNPDAVLSE